MSKPALSTRLLLAAIFRAPRSCSNIFSASGNVRVNVGQKLWLVLFLHSEAVSWLGPSVQVRTLTFRVVQLSLAYILDFLQKLRTSESL